MNVSWNSLTVHACSYWMKELTKIDKCFRLFFSSVVLLHVARKISRNGVSDELKDILSTTLGPITSVSVTVSCLGVKLN